MSINAEYFSTKGITGQIQKVIAQETAKALQEFARQEPEFEQAIEQSGKTFQACLDAVADSCDERGGVSDLEVYRKAVQFYFSTADIRFRMEIDLCADTGAAPKPQKETLSVSLDELLDF